MTNYDIKKSAAFEKKQPFLFLKRLENDGHQVKIHPIEKELFRYYGNSDEEDATKDLELALVADILGKPKKSIQYGSAEFVLALQSLEDTDENRVAQKKDNERKRIKALAYSSAKVNAVPKTMKHFGLERKGEVGINAIVAGS